MPRISSDGEVISKEDIENLSAIFSDVISCLTKCHIFLAITEEKFPDIQNLACTLVSEQTGEKIRLSLEHCQAAISQLLDDFGVECGWADGDELPAGETPDGINPYTDMLAGGAAFGVHPGIFSNAVVLADRSGDKSITNAAEAVTKAIHALHPGKRILYSDSEGRLSELLHDEGRFTGFETGPQVH